MRGSHAGAFEAAHALAREGKKFPDPADLDEEYDLVVVGGGIRGLAVAYYYRKQFGADSRILILENHDDFGGHAKRNEFQQGGQMRLSWGGTMNLEYSKFSDAANALLEELGVDIDELLEGYEFANGGGPKGNPSIFFDAETYGNELIHGFSFRAGRGDNLEAMIDRFPVRFGSGPSRLRTKWLCNMILVKCCFTAVTGDPSHDVVSIPFRPIVRTPR